MSATEQRASVDRNLALELVRTTEYAALAAARWIGRGEKEAADQAAVDAMRFVLDSVSMEGVVVIGEGEKDEAPMLYNGEHIGDGSPPVVDIAVDPLEGTRLCALGMPSALAVIALAERGTMFDPGPCVYMEKMAGGEEIADLLDLDRPLPKTLELIAERKGASVGDVTVVMLDRPRHEDAMKEVREAGGRIRLITDGDVSAALLAVSERSPVDLLWGIGGTPEGVLSAAALKSMGGEMLGRLWPRDEQERGAAVDAGYDLDRILTANDLCGGEEIADLLDLDRPLPKTLELIAERKAAGVGDVTVVMLDRPRHEEAMQEVRDAGGRIRLITDGDVSAALLAVSERSPVDLLWGIGGTPEGVLSAAALKSMGGEMLGRLWPRDDAERSAAVDAGYDLDRILTASDLCAGEDVFFSATGVTDGDVLQGVRYRGSGATTESLVMRSRSGTVRRVHARHDRSKLRTITGERYG